MLKIAIILAILCSGCATRHYKQLTGQVADYGISEFETPTATCYVYRDGDFSSMSCLRK